MLFENIFNADFPAISINFYSFLRLSVAGRNDRMRMILAYIYESYDEIAKTFKRVTYHLNIYVCTFLFSIMLYFS